MSRENQGEPVPSMILPLVIIMSNAAGNPAFIGKTISEKRRVRSAPFHWMQVACLMNWLQLRVRARADASIRDFHFDFPGDREHTLTPLSMQCSSQVFECSAFPTAAAKSQSQKLMLLPTHSSNTFPSPVLLNTDICFGLRLALLTVVNQFSGGTRGRV